MEHAQITPLKKSAQEHVDQLPTHTGSTETKVEASAVASPPDQDLNPLIYQLYARIKQLGPVVSHAAEEITRRLGGRWPHPH